MYVLSPRAPMKHLETSESTLSSAEVCINDYVGKAEMNGAWRGMNVVNQLWFMMLNDG